MLFLLQGLTVLNNGGNVRALGTGVAMKYWLRLVVVGGALAAYPLSSAQAQADQSVNLTPGQPAGIEKAQSVFSPTMTYVVAGVVAAAIIAVAVSGGGSGTNSVSTTGITP